MLFSHFNHGPVQRGQPTKWKEDLEEGETEEKERREEGRTFMYPENHQLS